MIRHLYIKNYAIIEELTIEFSNGLTIITGETGAGKSILLGALGLIMGRRADTKSLYEENEKCVIEGTFDVSRYDLQDFFSENELDYEKELVVRRELTPTGKSRSFVNDTPVKLKVLQQLSSALIDLHQQFDTLDIHNMSFQLKMLDALAGNRELLQQYRTLFQSYQKDKRQLSSLKEKVASAMRETEFINFQLEEFNKAELMTGEQEELEEELSRLTNAEEIKKTLGGAFNLLSESEQSVISQLEEVGVALNQVDDFDSRVKALTDRFNGILAELQDIGNEFEKLGEETEYDPERILEVQSRLDTIYRLETKHNVSSVEELQAIQQDLEAQLQGYTDLSDEIAVLETRIEKQEGRLIDLAKALSERRKSVTADFSQNVQDRLASLSMEHARMEVDFQVMNDLGPNGWDEVRFLFAANKGSKLQEIKDVASGGELSRLALVTKSLVASAIPLPTLIFDEIDTGISGDVALKMGNILRKLSDEHQVVSITHSPQIASKANRHYFVYKKVKEDRTVTRVKVLEEKERVTAIATMLSQNPPSDSAIENAKELLNQG